MKKITAIFLFYLNMLMAPLWANQQEQVLQRIDYAQGLSNSAVISLYQDSQGFMWFGTYDGLNNYDGKTMETYRTDSKSSDKLLNNVIYGVNGADDHCLWISTSMGVNRFSIKDKCVKASFENFKEDEYKLFSNRKGVTWVLDNNRVFHYVPSCNNFKEIPQKYHKFSSELSFVDEKGQLWLFASVGNGVYCCQAKTKTDSEAPTYGTVRMNIHSHKIIYTFYQNGILSFIDEKNDLFLFDIERSIKIYIRNVGNVLARYGTLKGIITFHEDIVLAFVQNGLVKLEASRSYQERVIDSSIRIFCAYKDVRQDIIWIGTDGKGVMAYAKKHTLGKHLLYNKMEDRISRQVRSIYTTQTGDLWFGTKGDGLIRIPNYQDISNYKEAMQKVTVYTPMARKPLTQYTRGNSEYQVFGITPSRYFNGLWISAAEDPGLAYYDPKQDLLVPLEGKGVEKLSKVHKLFEENDSVLWVATADSGLCKITLKQAALSQSRISKEVTQFIFRRENKEIRSFYPMIVENDSIMWLGSLGYGLVRFNYRTHAYQVYTFGNEKTKSVNDVLCIHRQGDTFYLGTVSGMVKWQYKEQSSSEAMILGRNNGMLNDMIHGILEDEKGFLWLSTNKGIVKYNPRNDTFHTYYYSNGLQIGEFSDDAYYACPYTGNLLFGGVNGLLVLQKKEVEEIPYYPEVHIRTLKLGMQEVPFHQHYDRENNILSLKGFRASFTLSFIAPDYIEGDNYEYSYRLKGYDEEWTPFTQNNTASFGSVPFGDYDLEIRYKKDVFDSEFYEYVLPIHIQVPWYLSPWAIIIYILLLGTAAYYAILLMRQYYHREKLVKELMLHEKMNAASGSRELHDYMAYLSDLYRTCSLLRQQGGMSDAYYQSVDNQYEDLLNLSFLLDERWGETPVSEETNSLFHWRVTEFDVQATSDKVVRLLIGKGCRHLTDLIIEINSEEKVNLPESLFKSLLLHLYEQAERVQGTVHIKFSKENRYLVIMLQFAEKQEQIEQITKGTPYTLYRFAMQQLKAITTCNDNQLRIEIPLMPVDESLPSIAGQERKTVFLLESNKELSSIIQDILEPDYEVHIIESIQSAFIYLRKHAPDLFMIDTVMYLKEKQILLEYIEVNKGLLSNVPIVPLVTWKSSIRFSTVYAHLMADFVILPYNLTFLKKVVDRVTAHKSRNLAPAALSILENKAALDAGDASDAEQSAFAQQLRQVIENHLDKEDLTSAFVASELNLSTRQYYRKLKEISNFSSSEYIKNYRIERAATLLAETDLPIQEIIGKVGIQSRSYFYKEFANRFGMTPKIYKQTYR